MAAAVVCLTGAAQWSLASELVFSLKEEQRLAPEAFFLNGFGESLV